MLACSGQPWNRVPMPGMLATGTDMTAGLAGLERARWAPDRPVDQPGVRC
jgi:hypothetical protein